MTDREKLVELLTAYYDADPAYYDVDAPSIADHLISNGVVAREKGEWERYADDKFNGYDAHGRIKYRKVYIYECSRCGENTAAKRNFCPNCGADMRGSVNDG